MAEYRQNTNYKDFKNDDEQEGTAALRLPFALCKANGIAIQDWWTPRHAWEALKSGGIVDDVSEEYKEFYRKYKKEASKPGAARSARRSRLKKKQKANAEHNPNYDYEHQDGAIAGVKKGEPMTFEQADSGNCNPYYMDSVKAPMTSFREGLIGYRTNCQTCVATYFARRQGYDVRALPNLDNKNIYDLARNTTLAYVQEDGTRPTAVKKPYRMDGSMFVSEQVQAGEIHTMSWDWRGKSSGHIVIAERQPGKSVMIYDPQTDTKYEDVEFFKKYGRMISELKLTNITNCELDEQFCDTIMKGVKK